MTSVLDTNIVLYHLGNLLAQELPTDPLCISVITEMELLSYPGLTPEEEASITAFLAGINIIDLDHAIKQEAIDLRKTLKLKLPDAIIVATAKALNATLLTNDTTLNKINGISVLQIPLIE